MTMWFSKLTGEIVADDKLDEALEEHANMFVGQMDEYDIMQSFVIFENGKVTETTLFDIIF